MKVLLSFIAILFCAPAIAAPLQTFEIEEPLDHQWTDELVHFSFDVPDGLGSMVLTDGDGTKVLWQFSDLQRDEKTKCIRGKVWTVVGLAPDGKTKLQLHREPNGPATEQPESDLSVRLEDEFLILANGKMAVRIPQWPKLAAPLALEKLPPPLSAVRMANGDWLGGAQWFNDGAALQVKQAATDIIQRGAVSITVRQQLTFVNGETYTATIQLGARQDAAKIAESTLVDAPQAGWKLSLQPGLNANHILWHNQWKETENAKSWSLTDTAPKFDKDKVEARLRPWSFWHLPDLTEWAGFYNKGGENFIGVLMLRPSRWSPTGWGGFDRTQIPIVSRAGGGIDLSFNLLATTKQGPDQRERALEGDSSNTKSSSQIKEPLRREWALSAGTVADNVVDINNTNLTPQEKITKMRRQLVKYSEFPLDEVKDYGFDFKPSQPNQAYPYLIVQPDDIARVRRQAKSNPVMKARIDASLNYVRGTHAETTLEKEGAEAFYKKNYIGNYLVEKLPEAYLGSDDPVYGKMLAAAVQNMTGNIKQSAIEAPSRPAIGANGPWYSENFTRLLFNYDLIAGQGYLSPEAERNVRNTLVFGAHFLAHPDYWNPEAGLASANPNMTSSIRLPRGLLGLYLSGHPKAAIWLAGAEGELKDELENWISPGGAWIEGPGYQAATLDGMFLLITALRNTGRHNYFNDPRLKSLMSYYGTLLTPPDRRFPPENKDINTDYEPARIPDGVPPMVLPSIGDTFAGFQSPFLGWMAKATVQTDPEYSRRQQFFWKGEDYTFAHSNRAKGMAPALLDPELPSEPPTVLQGAFPGFGSVSRTSWTDPKATYLAHRTGPNLHHYHDDYNSFVFYAKGAPLCLDFGNFGQPLRRDEPQYHNRVSFPKPDGTNWGSTGELVEARSLPSTLDYSYGLSKGGGGQGNHRHMLLVKSRDPLGANYVLVRDKTVDGQPNQQFNFNLWCLSKEPQINGNTVHFPGQFDVDLDVHLLDPSTPKITTDHWNWKQQIYIWRWFSEEQYGIHVEKNGSKEDYFTVLYPRAAGQTAAQVSTLANGAGAKIKHMEGEDFVLLSPDRPAEWNEGDIQMKGEIAFVRRNQDGAVRLANIKGQSTLVAGDWGLSSDGTVAIEIKNHDITGESSGAAQKVLLTLPPNYGAADVRLDGKAAESAREGRVLSIQIPAGVHRFSVKP